MSLQDCFFASVIIRDQPSLKDLPVVVSHSENATGSADIASANYVARAFGIKNGMWIRSAKELCPKVNIVGYDFPAFEEASRKMYAVLLQITPKLQVSSCDESILDVSDCTLPADAVSLAQKIRDSIFRETRGCTASVGIGHNALIARMASSKAKPDGVFQVRAFQAEDFVAQLPVSSIPSVGRKLSSALSLLEVGSCGDLRQLPIIQLKGAFGPKKGVRLFEFCRGIDTREPKFITNPNLSKRKSIGVDINWGVRLETREELLNFLTQLSEELEQRLLRSSSMGSCIVVKLKIRHKDAPEQTAKFMGHGWTTDLSKSIKLPRQTRSKEEFLPYIMQIMEPLLLATPIKDIRGVGIQLHNLVFDGETTKVAVVTHSSSISGTSISHCKLLTEFFKKREVTPTDPLLLQPDQSILDFSDEEKETDLQKKCTKDQPSMPVKKRKTVQQKLSIMKRPCKLGRKKSGNAGVTKFLSLGDFWKESVALLPPPSQVDVKVIDALPLNIKAEIQRAYELEGRDLDHAIKSKLIRLQQEDVTMASPSSSVDLAVSGSGFFHRRMYSEFSEFSSQLLHWIEQSREEVEQSLIQAEILEFVAFKLEKQKDLSIAKQMVVFLSRHAQISRHGMILQSTVEAIRAKVRDIYGGSLKST